MAATKGTGEHVSDKKKAPAENDVQRRMREALEAKKAREKAGQGEDHLGGHGVGPRRTTSPSGSSGASPGAEPGQGSATMQTSAASVRAPGTAAAGDRRVASTEPARMSTKPPAVATVNGSSSSVTPSSTATAGLT